MKYKNHLKYKHRWQFLHLNREDEVEIYWCPRCGTVRICCDQNSDEYEYFVVGKVYSQYDSHIYGEREQPECIEEQSIEQYEYVTTKTLTGRI